MRAAVAQRSDVVDLDVQRTKDGALVLMHDVTLIQTTDVRLAFSRKGSPWLLGDFTYDEIRRLEAGQWSHRAGDRSYLDKHFIPNFGNRPMARSCPHSD
ncbi:MAG: glycerophosphodiester phosphodiesterase family protein [Nocardioides sp.]